MARRQRQMCIRDRVYFGVSPSLLTVGQATFLAALPQRPSAYNPYRDPKPALRRQRRIIDVLVHEKLISPDEAHTARNERLQVQPAARAFACLLYTSDAAD